MNQNEKCSHYNLSGSQISILEKASDEIIDIHGWFPDNYQFENDTLLSETVIQTDRGMFS